MGGGIFGVAVRYGAVQCSVRGCGKVSSWQILGGSTVPATGLGSVCKSARSLVVLVQNPSILVYPQPAAPIPTLLLGVERHAPRLVAHRPARRKRGLQYLNKSLRV